jgi:hypothetical protein
MGAGLQDIEAVPVPMALITSVGLLDKSATKSLQPSIGEIARAILAELDDIGLRAAKAPSVPFFKEERQKLYPQFVRLTRAMSELLEVKLDRSDVSSIIETSQGQFQREVETEWANYFSSEIHGEILFGISTLRRAYALVRRVMASKLPDDPSVKEENENLRERYNLAAQWAQFHIEILKSAVRQNLTIAPEVLSEVLEGLRPSVMAYSFVRQAMDLRNVLDARYSEEINVVWDDEDTALANAE